MPEEKEEGLTLDKKTMEVLVAHIIPTSKYFEVRFDHLQEQVHDVKIGMMSLEDRMNKQFEQVDKRFVAMQADMGKRFEQVDKRFEQVDNRFATMQADMNKRFEQVDKRFEQIDSKLDKLIERVDVRIDAGLRENRMLTVKLFTFAMTFAAISMAGLLGKMLEIF